MGFLALCYRNVLRRKQRSLLTAFSVAIAVAAVVALVGVATGFRRDMVDYYEEVGVDLMAVGQADSFGSRLSDEYYEAIVALPNVEEVIPGLVDQTSFPEVNMPLVPISGLEPETMVFDHMEIVSGRMLTKDDDQAVMLGLTVAEATGKTAGDTIDIIEVPCEVVGVYQGFSVIENGSIVMPVQTLQEMFGLEGEVSGYSIVAEDGTSEAQLDELITQIEAIAPGKIRVNRPKEHVEGQTQMKSAVAMAWVTSAIAMVIGSLGMLNTMLMSLHERIGEIGLLRAVGWRRGRIAKMILAESVLLSLFGALIGVLAAFALVQLLTTLPAAAGFISGQIDTKVVLQSIGVALVLGVVGGLLPALSATRIAPAEALRH